MTAGQINDLERGRTSLKGKIAWQWTDIGGEVKGRGRKTAVERFIFKGILLLEGLYLKKVIFLLLS